MSDRAEPAFAVTGTAEILRRLQQIEKRRANLNDQFSANQREYEEIVERDRLLIAEADSLRMRLGSLREEQFS